MKYEQKKFGLSPLDAKGRKAYDENYERIFGPTKSIFVPDAAEQLAKQLTSDKPLQQFEEEFNLPPDLDDFAVKGGLYPMNKRDVEKVLARFGLAPPTPKPQAAIVDDPWYDVMCLKTGGKNLNRVCNTFECQLEPVEVIGIMRYCSEHAAAVHRRLNGGEED